jgi:WD40 repeat protein
VLISDGPGEHESLEVMTHCSKSDIILCRLPSHRSHELQSCDVGVFGPLKPVYRERVEQQFRHDVSATVIGENTRTLVRHNNMVTAVRFSSNGKTVAPGSTHKTIRLWNAATGEEG